MIASGADSPALQQIEFRQHQALEERVAALESGLRALLADCEDRLGLENVPYSAFVAARALLEGTE